MSGASRPVWQSSVHTVDLFTVDGVTVVACECPSPTMASLTAQQEAAVWARLTEGDTTVEVLTAMLQQLSQQQQQQQQQQGTAPHDDDDTLLQLVCALITASSRGCLIHLLLCRAGLPQVVMDVPSSQPHGS
jgi:hypothetical protein